MDITCIFGLFLLLLKIPTCLMQPVIPETSNLPYNFTLSAFNTSLPNSNDIGQPLVLGQNGATAGVTPHVTSTLASYPYNDYPSLALVNGTLRAFRADGSWNTNATEVTNGKTLNWITTTRYTRPAPEIYSAVTVPTGEYSVLAVRGRHDLWSLCPFPGPRGQTNVVFNVSVVNSSPPPGILYDPKLCYGVVLYIIRQGDSKN